MPDETTLYEAMYILDVTLDEELRQQAVTAVENAIAEHGGQLEQTLTFGQRRLAYEINHHVEGLYMITYFRGPGAVVRLLNHEFLLIETIIRGFIVAANPKTIFTEPDAEEPAALVTEEPEVEAVAEAVSAEEPAAEEILAEDTETEEPVAEEATVEEAEEPTAEETEETDTEDAEEPADLQSDTELPAEEVSEEPETEESETDDIETEEPPAEADTAGEETEASE